MPPLHLKISTLLLLLPFLRVTLAADEGVAFSFDGFDQDPFFRSNIRLYGEARLVRAGGISSVLLNGPLGSGAGQVVYGEPIRIVEGDPERLASFSTCFSFSLSEGNGGGLAFFMLPGWYDDVNGSLPRDGKFGIPVGANGTSDRVVAVEFGTGLGNHVRIDAGGFKPVEVKNVTSVFNGGRKLLAWIDYEAGSRRLALRMSQSGKRRPSDPLLYHRLDLWELWGKDPVYLGLASSSSSSNQTCLVYAWSFRQRKVPHWMHSQPLNPGPILTANTKVSDSPAGREKKNDCFLKVLGAMIFGTGCGALGAFVVLYVWTILGDGRPVSPEDFAVQPVDLKCNKVEVVVVGRGAKDSSDAATKWQLGTDKAIKDGESE